MRQEIIRPERLSGRGGQQLIGFHQARAGMDVLPQPAAQLRKIALGEGRADAGMGGAGRLEELRGGQGSEGVGRKIAEAAPRPVDVLKAAVPVVAKIVKPKSISDFAGAIPWPLSLSAKETKTFPFLGSGPNEEI